MEGIARMRDESSLAIVTIAVGEKYELMAKLSSDSCERYTGIRPKVIGAREMTKHGVRKPHHLKFRLFQEFPDFETIFYIDADTIFLKPFDLQAYRGLREIVCVRDVWERNWIQEDAARVGINPKEYFNSGFFIVNRTFHGRYLEKAEGMLGEIRSQFNDQTQLNAARAALGIPMLRLSREYNYLAFEGCREPETVTIGHLSGFRQRPLETIRRFYQYWARDPASRSAVANDKMRELSGKRFEYQRIGYDSRLMRLEEGGVIGLGRAGCEQSWEVREHEGELVLWIVGKAQPTCALVWDETAHKWVGRWMRAEQMLIALIPMAEKEGAFQNEKVSNVTV